MRFVALGDPLLAGDKRVDSDQAKNLPAVHVCLTLTVKAWAALVSVVTSEHVANVMPSFMPSFMRQRHKRGFGVAYV
jgi:predicted protein tyrosine phosphatase